MKVGTLVTSKDGKWMGQVREVKNTPDGMSVKVKRTDRKNASWYWAEQVTVTA